MPISKKSTKRHEDPAFIEDSTWKKRRRLVGENIDLLRPICPCHIVPIWQDTSEKTLNYFSLWAAGQEKKESNDTKWYHLQDFSPNDGKILRRWWLMSEKKKTKRKINAVQVWVHNNFGLNWIQVYSSGELLAPDRNTFYKSTLICCTTNIMSHKRRSEGVCNVCNLEDGENVLKPPAKTCKEFLQTDLHKFTSIYMYGNYRPLVVNANQSYKCMVSHIQYLKSIWSGHQRTTSRPALRCG